MQMIVGLVVSLSALFSSPAVACGMRSPFKAEFVDRADIVIEGRAISYELLERADNRERILSALGVGFEDIKTARLRRALLGTYAAVEIAVEDNLKGNTAKKIMVF